MREIHRKRERERELERVMNFPHSINCDGFILISLFILKNVK